jgi:hypothetical protein
MKDRLRAVFFVDSSGDRSVCAPALKETASAGEAEAVFGNGAEGRAAPWITQEFFTRSITGIGYR